MAEQPEQPPQVFVGINEIMADLAEIGIGKDQKNQQQGFFYRGIDDVYNALAKLLSKHKICIIPRVKARTCETRLTRANTNLYFVTLEVEYTIVSAVDGSQTTAAAFGEASDMADKATNKAMSTAYKYLCFQLFCIPVDVPDPDADSPPETVTHPVGREHVEVAESKQASRTRQTRSQKAASQPSTQPAASEQAKPDPDQLWADIAERVDAAKDDCDLVQIAGQVYKANKSKHISTKAAKDLAVAVTSKRSGMVPEGALESFRKMVASFAAEQLLTAEEAEVSISTVESRLNVAGE